MRRVARELRPGQSSLALAQNPRSAIGLGRLRGVGPAQRRNTRATRRDLAPVAAAIFANRLKSRAAALIPRNEARSGRRGLRKSRSAVGKRYGASGCGLCGRALRQLRPCAALTEQITSSSQPNSNKIVLSAALVTSRVTRMSGAQT